MTQGKTGIGIIGLGRWAHAHAHAAARSDSVEIVSCFTRDEHRRKEFAKEFGVLRTATSYEDLLADEEVEAIVISTPNDLHVEMGLAAIEANKAALIDKPVTVDIASGLKLLRAAPSGNQIGVAHHARRLGGIRAMKRWLDSQDTGSPRMAHADFSNARGRHMKPDAWHRNVQGSQAGVLIQVGIHQIDNLLWLLGSAVAVNARFSHQTLGTMPDASVVTIHHASGAISTTTSSWTTPGLFRIELQAPGGNLRYRLDHSHWSTEHVDDHGELILDQDSRHGQTIESPKGDPLTEQLNELGDAARGVQAMEVDVAAGLRAFSVVSAAIRSAENHGAEVDIADLLKEHSASSEEAALLTS